ncbi:MAG: DUF523 domain-containing protein [Pseudomonadota bacterium]
MILISACLCGCPCRYDGRRLELPEIIDWLKDQKWTAVCPEQLGGLPTPRPPASLRGGDGAAVLSGQARVIDAHARDVTPAYIAGAETVLELARRLNVDRIYLKDRSPSCGVRPMIDETGQRRGQGVCAALLAEAGFELIEVQASGRRD